MYNSIKKIIKKKILNASLDGFTSCFLLLENILGNLTKKNWGNFIVAYWHYWLLLYNAKNWQKVAHFRSISINFEHFAFWSWTLKVSPQIIGLERKCRWITCRRRLSSRSANCWTSTATSCPSRSPIAEPSTSSQGRTHSGGQNLIPMNRCVLNFVPHFWHFL